MKSVCCLLGALCFSLVVGMVGARESVVFVEAHPDDLAGHLGTALKLSEKFDVHIIDFTHGELGCGWEMYTNGWTKATRTAEEGEVCRRAGFRLHWCDAIDGFAYADSNVCAQLTAYLADIRPRAVFCHWPIDTHPDHMMSAVAAMKSVRLAGLRCELYFHEQDIQSRGFQVAYHVDVTPYVAKKAELTRLYACQHGDDIARRKAESSRVYARNSLGSTRNVEVIGVFHGTVPPGKSVFDGLDGVSL